MTIYIALATERKGIEKEKNEQQKKQKEKKKNS